MKLHVVSFQVPFPPDYGGLIDVYYKLKALKDAGCNITLHTYQYGTDKKPELLDVVDTVYYYERYTGVTSLFSYLPYIVYSRRNPLLLERLCEDDAPILFEGLHTCYFLSNVRLKDREKWVRMHNIEHDYYEQLADSTTSWKKNIYYRLEATKLRYFERKLKYANRIFAITQADTAYLAKHYPMVKTNCLPCFYDTTGSEGEGTDDYILYHGNLAVDENIKAAHFILDEVLPRLRKPYPIVIAGNAPDKTLVEKIKKYSQVCLIANPTKEEMDALITSARINLLLTFQYTGIKLKLLYALRKGRGHCLVNSPMIPDDNIRFWCHTGDTAEELAWVICHLHTMKPSVKQLQERKDGLDKAGYNNQVTLILH